MHLVKRRGDVISLLGYQFRVFIPIFDYPTLIDFGLCHSPVDDSGIRARYARCTPDPDGSTTAPFVYRLTAGSAFEPRQPSWRTA